MIAKIVAAKIAHPKIANPKNALSAISACGLLLVATGSASAELLSRKDLSLDIALLIAQTASQTCKANGYKVTVTVVDRAGQPMVQLRGDNASPHTYENSMRKAYTARTMREPSSQFAERVKKNPTTSQVFLANFAAAQGGVPIKVGDDVIGAVGVSGSPGGDKDEVCAKAGLDKAADQLK